MTKKVRTSSQMNHILYTFENNQFLQLHEREIDLERFSRDGTIYEPHYGIKKF